MTLPVVAALVVFLALTVGAFLLGACRASRDAQAESRRHVEELSDARIADLYRERARFDKATERIRRDHAAYYAQHPEDAA